MLFVVPIEPVYLDPAAERPERSALSPHGRRLPPSPANGGVGAAPVDVAAGGDREQSTLAEINTTGE